MHFPLTHCRSHDTQCGFSVEGGRMPQTRENLLKGEMQ